MYDVQDNRDDILCPQRRELLAIFWCVISKWNRTLGGIPSCRRESMPIMVGLGVVCVTYRALFRGTCVRNCEPSDF